MDPQSVDQCFKTAVAHHEARRFAQAEQGYRQVLADQPNHAGAMHLMGVLAHQAGKGAIGVQLIRQALILRPNWPEAIGNLGCALTSMGQLDEAIAACRAAAGMRPQEPNFQSNLGNALQARGQLDDAIAAYRRALELRPDFADARSNLGAALFEKGQVTEAMAEYRRAIAVDPNHAQALSNLAAALTETGQTDEAIAVAQRAVALQPGLAEAHSNLGNALKMAGNLNQAIACQRKALSFNPKFAKAYNNLGSAMGCLGQVNDAIAVYRQAITLAPQYAEAHANLAMALLTRGDFAEGWQEYEWRTRCRQFRDPPRQFAPPLWDGKPIPGKTLLLHAEQGLGDAMQFVRYVPLAAERAGRTIVECPPELRRLIEHSRRLLRGAAAKSDDPLTIIARGEPLPSFDAHCSLLSLPRVLGTTLESIPHEVPYLCPDPELVNTWRDRMGVEPAVRNVGIVWAGNPSHENDRNRSIALSRLQPLLRTPEIRFHSLQKGAAQRNLATLMDTKPSDWSEHLTDFAETAAIIASLDLVISVDTAVAHLVGAMGKPVWLLVSFDSEWRWMRERTDSPWYPTMRVFRQTRAGDWETVVRQVQEALSGFADEG